MKFVIDKGDKNISKPLPNSTQSTTDTPFIHYNIYQPSSRVQCDHCKRNISKGAKILMLTQQAKYLDLCMFCFSNINPFQTQYHIINKLDFPLLQAHWTAQEELLLLEGLQTHGYGNWNDVANFVGGGKSKEEVQQHYQRVYLDHPNFMPENQILTTKTSSGELVWNKCSQEIKEEILEEEKPSLQAPTANRNITPATAQSKQSTTPAEVVGYMPRRGDFEIEYDNDAELLLAEMQFNDDDSEQEKMAKLRLMDIYNHKLSERIKRKQFVSQRKLLDLREQMRLDKTRTKEEKEIYNLMKVLARFNNPEQHQKFVQNIIKAKQLRQRIAQIKELLSKGFRTWGEVEDQLQGKKKKEDKNKKKDETSFLLDKNKTTRRVARKDQTTQKSQKKILYVTKQQQQLCNKQKMTFRQYITIKQKILREAVRCGIVNVDELTKQINVKKNISEAVLNFLVEQQDVVVNKKEEIVANIN